MGDHKKGVTGSNCTPSAGQIATNSDWVALASTTRREHEVIIGVVKESLSERRGCCHAGDGLSSYDVVVPGRGPRVRGMPLPQGLNASGTALFAPLTDCRTLPIRTNACRHLIPHPASPSSLHVSALLSVLPRNESPVSAVSPGRARRARPVRPSSVLLPELSLVRRVSPRTSPPPPSQSGLSPTHSPGKTLL